MKNIFERVCKAIATMALMSSTKSANQSCALFAHQASVPDKVKQLRKF